MIKRMGNQFCYSYESVYLIIIPVITNINNNHNETAMSKHSTSFLTIARRLVMYELVYTSPLKFYHIMQSQIQVSESRNRTYKQRTSNICLLTYLCIYSERERETETERERAILLKSEAKRQCFSQHDFPVKQFFYCSFTSV